MRTVTANYTTVPSDYIINGNGTFTITLDTAGLTAGQSFRIKNIGTGTITVQSAALIDGSNTSAISTQWNAFDYHWDGTQFYRGAAVQMSNTRMGQGTVDFGGAEGDTASVTIAATWIQTTSIVLANAAALATADHDPEDAVIEGIQAKVINIIPGVSFDIEAYAPLGSFGQYIVTYQGLISRSNPTS